MNRAEVFGLIQKYNKGECTAEETAMLETWYVRENKLYQEELSSAKMQADLDAIARQLTAEHDLSEDAPVRTVKLWPRFWIKSRMTGLAIAAAVATIVFGVWLFTAPDHDSSSLRAQRGNLNDIPPGRSGATITLANGEVIQLDSTKKGVVVGTGSLTYDDGTSLSLSGGDAEGIGGSKSHTLSGQRSSLPGGERSMMMAKTARGQTYQLTLSDGTRVWLNADSKISFPVQFLGKERKIFLEGEAYFVVKHDAKQPFRVVSKGVDGRGQVVEDIGTEFNINAYSDEANIKTTLIEGAAKVIADLDEKLERQNGLLKKNAITLTPNQQATLSKRQIKVSTVDPETAIDWKNGVFMFENEQLGSIMRRVAKWYNVEIVYADQQVAQQVFSGSVSRFDSVLKLLKKLEGAGPVEFEIKGRIIKIKPK